jgi:hypothetical protein
MAESRRYAPGPDGWPFIGNLPELRRDVLAMMMENFFEYGDLVRFKLGPLTVHLLSSPVRDWWSAPTLSIGIRNGGTTPMSSIRTAGAPIIRLPVSRLAADREFAWAKTWRDSNRKSSWPNWSNVSVSVWSTRIKSRFMRGLRSSLKTESRCTSTVDVFLQALNKLKTNFCGGQLPSNAVGERCAFTPGFVCR